MAGEEEEIKKIILASSSPRRSEIFTLLKIDHEVIEPTGCEEKILKDTFETVVTNSALKVRDVFGRGIIGKNNLIVGFDTLLYYKGRFFGKPRDIDEARVFLKTFSGRKHRVVSGISILDTSSQKMFSNTDVTVVKFRELTQKDIEGYLQREDVLDKAGGYNIMGFGCSLVRSIKGCFYNVAGVPVSVLIELLKRFDYKFL